MPDSPLFPSFDLEMQDIRSMGLQNEGRLPDYGIPQTMQNIGDIYAQIGAFKSRSPLLKAQGGIKNPEDAMFPSIKEAISPRAKSSDALPTPFDPVAERLDRYTDSKYYKNIGFLPGRDNEELYGRAQSSWGAMMAGISGAWKLAKFQFVDQLKGWGRMVDGIFSGDLTKLYDQGDIEHVNNELDRIMNANPVFTTEKDRNSIFTWANFANVVQQSGFTLGAVSEIAAEELLLSAITVGTAGGGAPLQGARTASLVTNMEKALNRIGRTEEVLMDAGRTRKLFGKIAEYTPLSGTIQTLAKGARVEESSAQLALRGFGSFYRDLREANAAFTEARAETSGTYTDLKRSLLSDVYDTNQPITQDKLDKIDSVSREAADANFWANSAIISISNRIQFDNIFRGFKGSTRLLSDVGEVAEDAKGYFKRAAVPFTKGFIRTARAEAFPKFFKYFKNNLTEALQENLQNISNNSIQSYYKANYHNPGSGIIKDSIYDAISGEFTTQGAQTFLSGFLTGAITSPLTHGIPNLYNRVSTPKVQRQARQTNIQNQLTVLNGFFSKPEGRNSAVQFSISGAMGQAIKNKDIKGFQDLQDHSVRQFVRTALETGKVDSLFMRLESIARGLTKEEFHKAFNIEYSEDNHDAAMDYISKLHKRTEEIKKTKDALDYQFPNPFTVQNKNTPEENAKIANARALFEEAKWHISYIKDAHLRTSQRQSSIMRDMQEEMKEMSYSALFTLLDKKKAKDEIKMLRQEASLSNDPRTKTQKEKKANLLDALLPSIERGNIDPKTFTEYVNHIQETDNRPGIDIGTIETNRKRLDDYFALNDDKKDLFNNINWLADPKNFADFFQRHQQYEATENLLNKTQEAFEKDKLEPIRQEHPGYDITIQNDENRTIKVTPKDGEAGSDEELNNIKDKIEKSIQGEEEPKVDENQQINDRLSDIYDKLSETGKIDDQDRAFLNLENVKKIGETNPDYIKIKAILNQLPPPLPQQQPKSENEPSEDPTTGPTNDEEDAYPHYEGSDKQPEPQIAPGATKTVIQEVVDGFHDGKRDENGDVILEGGYSFVRGQITRLFKNNPHLIQAYEFAIVRDNRAFYEHVDQMDKDTKEKLDVMNKNSPYRYFIQDNKKSQAPVIVIRDRKTKRFIYFNPFAEGMITDAKKGVIAALTFDYTKSGFTREQVVKFLESQPGQEFRIEIGDIDPISTGSFFENKGKLRNINEFFDGVNENHEGQLHISQGLKDEEWNHPENTRNGGAFISVGNVNMIKLLPSKLSEIKIGNEPYNVQELFGHSYAKEEADNVSRTLQKIIYKGVFRPKNQDAEKIIVSYEPSKDEKGKYNLKLIRLIDTTPDVQDSRSKIFKDSQQSTDTILNYLFKGERRMNVMVDIHQDISIPYLENGNLQFATMNYQQFLATNLFTNKARVVNTDGTLDINPVNNFFIFPGLADIITSTKATEAKAAEAVAPITGEEPAKPEGLPEGNNPFKESKIQEPVYRANTEGKFSQNDGNGTYFTTNKDYAELYTWDAAKGEKIEGMKVEPHFVDLKNPLRITTKGPKGEAIRANIDKAKEQGHDGIIASDPDIPSANEMLVFNDAQIKKVESTKPEWKKEEDKKLPSAKDLLERLRKETNKGDTPIDPDEIIPKLKDGVERALIGNEELQFIKDRFGDHVLNHMTYAVNSDYWGYWKSGMITLYSDAKKGVGYHEAWHHFSQMFLTKAEKAAMYKEYSDSLGVNNANLQSQEVLKGIEEGLADQFAEFVLSEGTKLPITPVRRNIFQKIWDFLKRMFTGKKSLNDLFKDLYQGKLEAYRPSINNAMWGRLNYGFVVTQDGKQMEVFDAKEYNVAKGFFNVLLHRAFSSNDEDYNLKAENISMAGLMGLRENNKLKDKVLRSVYKAVNNQLIKHVDDNVTELDQSPATLSILERMINHLPEFFAHSMKNLQIPANVEDIVDQEEIEEGDQVVDIAQVKNEDGENELEVPTLTELEPGTEEAQFSDKILPFQDKGLLASVSKVMRNLIVTIPRAEVKYDREGRIQEVTEYKNAYNLPEPCDAHRVISVLGEELAGLLTDDEMMERLNSDELLQRLPEVHFLRQALPGFGVEGKNYSVQTVMSIMRDFNRVFVPVFAAVQLENDKIIMVEKTKNTQNKIKRAWQDNFLRTGNTVVDSSTTVESLDPKFGKKNWDLARKTNNNDTTISNRIKYLANLGITVSGRTSKTREFRDLVGGNKFFYFADSLSKRLENGQVIENPIRDISQPFYVNQEGETTTFDGESAFINELIRLESLYSDMIPSNVFITAKGTKKYALMLPNMFNIVGNTLRKAQSRNDLASRNHLAYLVDPENYYMNNSLVMRSLFNNQGLKRSAFEFGDYNGIEFRVYDKRVNKQTFEITGREKLIANINSLLESGVVDVMRTGSSESFYFYRVPEWYHSYEMRTGEKLEIPYVKNVPFSHELYSKGKPNENFRKAFRGYFFNLLVDELSVMKFTQVPRSRKTADKLKGWGVFEDMLSPALKSKLEKIEVTSQQEIRNKIHPFLDEFVKEVEDFFFDAKDRNSLTNRFLKYAERFGIYSNESGQPNELINDSIKSKYKTSWRDLAANFVLNNFVMNVEYSRIFAGAPQFYKDYHKRASGPMSPGNNANTGSIILQKLRETHRNTMASAIGKEFKENIEEFNTNVVTDDFSKLDREIEISWKQVAKILGNEQEMKEVVSEYNQTDKKQKPVNDGQAWATLDFYRRFRIQVGNWNFDTDEIEYNKEVLKWKIRTGKYQSEEQKAAMQAYIDRFPKTLSTFPIAKLQYNGPQKGRGLMLPVFHKYAVAPLIPSGFIDTPLEDMHNWMLDKELDYTTAESGSKNFTTDPLAFWKDEKHRQDFNVELEQTPNILYSTFLKEQIKTSRDIKGESTWGTQIRSLWLSNRFNNGQSSEEIGKLFDSYRDDLNGLIEAERQELFRELGITEEGDTVKVSNVKGFVETLQEQVKLRDLNSNIKRSITYDEITGNFETPLEIITNRQSIIDLIGGMVFKRLIRIKTNGDMLIQMSSTGTVKKGDSELRFYQPLIKNGKFVRTLPAQSKIAFNKHFYPLLNLTHPDGKKIKTLERLNEALKDDKWMETNNREVTVIAYRFPTEGPNSMEFMNVAEFLPEVLGSTMIVPREIVIKVGSDFDHDKLNMFRPTYNKEGKIMGPEAKVAYEKSLERMLKIQKRDESLSSLIQAIFDGVQDDNEDELDIEIDSMPMSEEDRNTIKGYMQSKRDLKGYYTNRAVDSYIKSLSSPEMFMQLIKPNTTKEVKQIAMDMAKREGLEGFTPEGVKAFVNTQIFDYTSNHIKFLQNVQGRSDLAVFAVLNKMLQNLQVTGTKLNETFIYTYPRFNQGNKINVKNTMKTTPHLLTKVERDSFMEGGKLPLGYNTDIKGDVTSHMISELMNATVDIEKDAFYVGLGINRYNKGIAAMMMVMRVPLERISAFLLQPMMKEYYRRQEAKPFFKADFNENSPAVYATNVNAREMLGLKNRRALEDFIVKNQNMEHGGVFSYDNLLETIGEPNWKTNNQAVLFSHFLALQRMQKFYMKIQSIVTTDTKKIASPVSGKNYEANVEDLKASKIIDDDNIERLQNRSFTSMFTMKDVLAKVFASIMPIGFSEVFTQAVSDKIKESDLFTGRDQMLKMERTFANDYMIYIILEKGEYEGVRFREYVARQLSKKINPNTLMKRLTEMQDSYPKLFSFYSLANKLRTNQSRKNKNLQNVELLRGADNSTDMQEVMISEFQKLIHFTGKEVPGETYSKEDVLKIRNFFKDLAVTALGQSGFNKSLFYMTDILPLEEIHPLAVKALNEYKKQIKADPNYEKEFIDAFIRDFVKENPGFELKGGYATNTEPWRGKYLNKPVTIVKPAAPAGPQRRFFRTNEIIKREQVRDDAGTLYIFGDNLLRTGLGGQAKEMRGEPNAIGIVTKRKPANDNKSFFSDATLEENKKLISADVGKAIDEFKKGGYTRLIVPQIGVGLAKLPTKAPLTWAFLQEELNRLELAVNGGVVQQQTALVEAAPAANKTVVPEVKGITFEQDTTSGYAARTKKNASADATIAIAAVFDSAGEKLTKSSVLGQNKLYLPIAAATLSNIGALDTEARQIAERIIALGKPEMSLNIAGNGIYTMRNVGMTQADVDAKTLALMTGVQAHLQGTGVRIISIVTGGQTGFDEAGAKAGRALGIPTRILAPRGWVFRDINGRDIADEVRFKARFTEDTALVASKVEPPAPETPPPTPTEIDEINDILNEKDQGC